MENIRYIRTIMGYGPHKNGTAVGDCLYYVMPNSNRAKVYVGGGGIYNESHGIKVEIVNSINGKVDEAYFPFKNYFKPVRCCPDGPEWYQHFHNGTWYFANYLHCRPKTDDYQRIATAVCEYMDMFS